MENAYHLGHPANIKLPGDKKKLINEAKFLKNKITKEEKLSGRCFLVYVPTAANKLLFNQSFKHLKKNQVQKLGKFKRSMFRAPVFIMLADFRNRGS
jgi:hypothetical protein